MEAVRAVLLNAPSALPHVLMTDQAQLVVFILLTNKESPE